MDTSPVWQVFVRGVGGLHHSRRLSQSRDPLNPLDLLKTCHPPQRVKHAQTHTCTHLAAVSHPWGGGILTHGPEINSGLDDEHAIIFIGLSGKKKGNKFLYDDFLIIYFCRCLWYWVWLRLLLITLVYASCRELRGVRVIVYTLGVSIFKFDEGL